MLKNKEPRYFLLFLDLDSLSSEPVSFISPDAAEGFRFGQGMWNLFASKLHFLCSDPALTLRAQSLILRNKFGICIAHD